MRQRPPQSQALRSSTPRGPRPRRAAAGARPPPTPGADDLVADPFEERAALLTRGPLQLLGAPFRFESNSEALLGLVDAAYAGLPAHALPKPVPVQRVRLLLSPPEQAHGTAAPPPLQMLSGPGLLGAAPASSAFAVISPQSATAMIRVPPSWLEHPYHTRYELLELAVFTLAARSQGLVPLHAACVGLNGAGVLLMGASGAGKSTLALACLLAGFDFVSEDATFVTPDSLLATGVANFVHVRAEGLRFVSQTRAAAMRRAPVIRRRSGQEKLEIDLRHGGHRLAAAPLQLAAVVFVSAVPGEGPLLAPMRRPALRARLAAEQPYAAGRPEWPLFCRRLAGIPAFELRRARHPQVAAECLRGLLADGDRP